MASNTSTSTTRKRRTTTRKVSERDQRLSAAARLQAEIQALEAKLVEHRQWFLAECQRTGEDHLQLGDFHAYQRRRSNWTYSARLHNEKLSLENQQKLEQREGIATNNPTPYIALVYKASL